MAIRGINLRKMRETLLHRDPVNGRRQFAGEVRALLGITEHVETGEPCIDFSKRALRAQDFDLAEVTQELLGTRDARTVKEAWGAAQQVRLMEAEGGVVLPSALANVSAYTDTVGGLIDAMIMEAYQSPQFIGDELMTTKEARVQGGYDIGVRNEGGDNESLDAGEPYPTVGLLETRVHIPDNQRKGRALKLNQEVFIYDRTDQVQAAAENVGFSVRREKEIRQADCVMGRTNTHQRDGVYTNTYRTTAQTDLPKTNAGTNPPNGYINAATGLPLVDWKDINAGFNYLEANVDPASGYEINIDMADAQLLVSPHTFLNTQTIINATETQTRTPVNTGGATGSTTSGASLYAERVRTAPNPLNGYRMTAFKSRIWYNRLTRAGFNSSAGYTGAINAATALGDTVAKAQSIWLAGQFKRAFRYRQILPFRSFQAPLSSEDSVRSIVAVWVAEELGVAYCVDPRYVFFGVDSYAA